MNPNPTTASKLTIFFYRNHSQFHAKEVQVETVESWETCLQKKSEWESRDKGNICIIIRGDGN